MKYYSEITKRHYNTEKACLEAEEHFQRKQEAEATERKKAAEMRRQRAEEVDAARKDFLAARDRYNDLMTKFCKDYGAYHYSVTDEKNSLGDILFDTFLNMFN